MHSILSKEISNRPTHHLLALSIVSRQHFKISNCLLISRICNTNMSIFQALKTFNKFRFAFLFSHTFPASFYNKELFLSSTRAQSQQIVQLLLLYSQSCVLIVTFSNTFSWSSYRQKKLYPNKSHQENVVKFWSMSIPVLTLETIIKDCELCQCMRSCL